VETIIISTPALTAALNGTRSLCSWSLVAAMLTGRSSVLTVARPRPGKCLGVATTPPSWSPSAKATPTFATTSGSDPKVRLLIEFAVVGWATSRTGARSTLTPRPLR
jgi:hypothetical protein